MTSGDGSPHQPPVFLAFFFLCVEPFMAITGALLSLFAPAKLLTNMYSSQAPNPVHITPGVSFLLTNLGACYAMFGLNEALVLRLSQDLRVWQACVAAMLVCDIGHVWAAGQASRLDFLYDFGGWTSEDWVGLGTLYLGLVLRVLYLGWSVLWGSAGTASVKLEKKRH